MKVMPGATIRRVIKGGLLLVGALSLVVGAANAHVLYSTRTHIQTVEALVEAAGQDSKDYDCIMVLGCGVRGTRPSPMLRDRLNQGIALYKAGIAPKLLMTGDHHRKGYNEVQIMKDYALDAGIPSADVFMDHAGLSTYDSMARARTVFEVKRMVVVTQAYHLNRAIYLSKSMGIETTGVATEPTAYSGQTLRDIREIAARVKAMVYAQMKPKTYISGPVIPIQGDGDITNDDHQ